MKQELTLIFLEHNEGNEIFDGAFRGNVTKMMLMFICNGLIVTVHFVYAYWVYVVMGFKELGPS